MLLTAVFDVVDGAKKQLPRQLNCSRPFNDTRRLQEKGDANDVTRHACRRKWFPKMPRRESLREGKISRINNEDM